MNVNSTNQSVAGYDRLARWYSILEWLMFGTALSEARLSLVDKIVEPKRVIILGDGTGRLLKSLCDQFPDCHFVSVDHSAQMMHRQKQRLSRSQSQRVEWVCEDAMSFESNVSFESNDGDFDLMVTAFFLDCFSDESLNEAMPRFLDMIKIGGQFYFADFIVPESEKPNRIVKAKLWLMHRVFRWATGLRNQKLPNWERLFERQPLKISIRHDSHHGMITTRIYTLQHEDHKRLSPSDR